MKLLRNAVMVTGIAIAGLLMACQNEDKEIFNTVGESGTAVVNDKNAKTSSDIRLIKDGDKELIYANIGRTVLWKETDQTLNNYWEFTYGPQAITATKYNQATKQQLDVDSYTLDANGLCTQSLTDNVFNYEYNADGQLAKCYNKFEPNERQEFSYESDPGANTKSLSKITFYDKLNTKKRELAYSYTAGGFIPDLNPLNPECLPINGRKYLPIFGKFNTNLVKYVVDNTFLQNDTKLMTGYQYEYVLDATGRVKIVTIKKTDGSIHSVTQRKYSSPIAGI